MRDERVLWCAGPVAVGGWIAVAAVVALNPPQALPVRGPFLGLLAVVTSLGACAVALRLPYKVTSTVHELAVARLVGTETIPRTMVATIWGQRFGGYLVIELADARVIRILGPCSQSGGPARSIDHILDPP